MLFGNLHGAVGKKMCDTVLASLAQSGKLVEKAFGKQKVYWYNQELLEGASSAEDAPDEAAFAALKEEQTELKAEVGRLGAAVGALKAQPTDAELDTELKRLRSEGDALREELATLRSGYVLIRPEERERVRAEYSRTRGAWQKRRSMFYEIAGQLLESVDRPMQWLVDECGVARDEDVGVAL